MQNQFSLDPSRTFIIIGSQTFAHPVYCTPLKQLSCFCIHSRMQQFENWPDLYSSGFYQSSILWIIELYSSVFSIFSNWWLSSLYISSLKHDFLLVFSKRAIFRWRDIWICVLAEFLPPKMTKSWLGSFWKRIAEKR